MVGAGARNVGEWSGGALKFSEAAEPGNIAERDELGGASNREGFEGLFAEQEQHDQLFVGEGLQVEMIGRRRKRGGVVTGTPGGREVQRGSHVAQAKTARLAEQG